MIHCGECNRDFLYQKDYEQHYAEEHYSGSSQFEGGLEGYMSPFRIPLWMGDL